MNTDFRYYLAKIFLNLFNLSSSGIANTICLKLYFPSKFLNALATSSHLLPNTPHPNAPSTIVSTSFSSATLNKNSSSWTIYH